jgi:hypothetical protein
MEDYLKDKGRHEEAINELEQAKSELQQARQAKEQLQAELVEERALAYAGEGADVGRAEKAYKNAVQAVDDAEIKLETLQRAVSLLAEKEQKSFVKYQQAEEKNLSKKADKNLSEMVQLIDRFLVLKADNDKLRDDARNLQLNGNAVVSRSIENNLEFSWGLNSALIETAKRLKLKGLKSPLFTDV